MIEPMLTVKEVAEHLRLCTKEVRKLLKSGELPGVNVARGSLQARWRIDPASLERFKLRMSNSPAPPPTPKMQARPDYKRVI